MNGLSLCSGIGGMELALRLAVPGYRTVCWVESDRFCQSILCARMRDGWLDPAPLWDDLRTFPARDWIGRVDLVSAGFPCQPWSLAGRRRGAADDRWLWPDIARILAFLRPAWVFLENVPGIITGGLGDLLADLAALGYDAAWDCLSAASCGAPHRRERFFLLAYAGGRGALEHAPGLRRGEGWTESEPERWGDAPIGPGSPVSVGIFPPGPADHDAWRAILARFPERAPAIESGVRGMAHGIPVGLDRVRPSRRRRLAAMGNAVVPVQGAVAFTRLLSLFTH